METISIYNRLGTLLKTVIITQDAQHEQELMKSDFVKLSWSDAEYYSLPVGAYVTFNGLQYALLEPFLPEQKSEAEWKYEPKFQHPVMYLGKCVFERPSYDTSGNDITYIDWPYTGSISTLLEYFRQSIIKYMGLTGENPFGVSMCDIEDKIISVQFSSNDVLSALSNTANVCECEWHIDWTLKTLFFGKISIQGQTTPLLTIGDNVQVPSRRDSKEGYWNAFLPQGSTRNIMRKSVSQEFVQSDVRLSLRKYKTDEFGADGKYPDGIVYTNGNGEQISKSEFDLRGEKAFIKPLIFEDVYPKQDLYVYNVRYRERYRLDENGEKVVSYTDDDGTLHYLRYAVWYVRLAMNVGTHSSPSWKDYSLEGPAIKAKVIAILSGTRNYELDIPYNARYFNQGERSNVDIVIRVGKQEYSAQLREYTDDTVAYRSLHARLDLTNAELSVGDEFLIIGGLASDVDTYTEPTADYRIPSSDIIVDTAIIDGKKPIIAFQPNTEQGAQTTPLAGLGSGDGEGHYGFAVKFLRNEKRHDPSYIIKANLPPTLGSGDTGVVDLNGNRSSVSEEDFEIEFEESDTSILPSTFAQGIYPKGASAPLLTNNKVNIYNVVVSENAEESAKAELEEKTLEYITESLKDNNSRTLKSNPVSFESSNPSLFLGQKVVLDDGLDIDAVGRDNEEHRQETRVMKLVTKLDFAFEQEITVGNQVLKGSNTQVKEKVDAIISGNMSVGNTMSDSYINSLIAAYTNPRFLSKIANDIANGHITFQQGIDVIQNAIMRGSVSMQQGFTTDGRATFKSDARSDTFETGVSGWKIDRNGIAELEYLKVRSVLEVVELLINRLQAQEGDTLYSDNDQIIDVEERVVGNETSYILTLKEKWEGYFTAQMYGNIVKGIINTLAAKDAGVSDETGNNPDKQGSDDGGNKYYTSWMRVVGTHNTNPSLLDLNQIEVVMYGDDYIDPTTQEVVHITPAGKNFPPCKMMTIARWGCFLDPNEEGITESEKQSRIRRQRLFMLSTSDGRVVKYTEVNKPILEKWNYGVTIGELPDFVKNYADVHKILFGYTDQYGIWHDGIGEHTDWLYAQGIVVQNFVQVSRDGAPKNHYEDCHEWVDGSQIQNPTPRHGIYFVYEFNEEWGQYETHDVWHNYHKWRCLQHQPVVVNGVATYYEPKWNSLYWKMIEGNDNYSIEFESTKGYSFRRGFVDTYVRPHLFFGNYEITDDADISNASWCWERTEEHPTQEDIERDRTWNAQHTGLVMGADVKNLHLTNLDMPTSWSSANKAIFTCKVTLTIGNEQVEVINQVIA